MSSKLTTQIKAFDLDNLAYRYDFYGKTDLTGLKDELTFHYKQILKKPQSLTSRIVGQLMALVTPAGNHAKTKQLILRLVRLLLRNNSQVPFEVFACLYVMTFPTVTTIIKAAATFNTSFTANDVLTYITDNAKTLHVNEVPDLYNVKQALATCVNVGLIKRHRRGVYMNRVWPVFNTLSLYIVLATVLAVSKQEKALADILLRHYSFKLDKDFCGYFTDLAYSDLAGTEILEKFQQSSSEFTLQYNNGWELTSNEMIYQDVNLPESNLPKNCLLTVADAVIMLQNEKN